MTQYKPSKRNKNKNRNRKKEFKRRESIYVYPKPLYERNSFITTGLNADEKPKAKDPKAPPPM